MMMDEDALLQRAFALSMGGDGSVPTTGGAMRMTPHFSLCCRCPYRSQVLSGMESGDVLTDASYVNSITLLTSRRKTRMIRQSKLLSTPPPRRTRRKKMQRGEGLT